MAKIRALYEDDERQYMEFNVKLTADNQIDETKRVTGFAIEWEESKNNYTRWPFVVSPDEEHRAFVEWEGSNQLTTIDLMGRNIVVGATFTRTDGVIEGGSDYRIESVRDT